MQRDRALGQRSLFASAETETEPPLPEVEEWERNDLLAGEKEMLGFFVTGHPLQQHRRPLEFFSQVSIEGIGQEHKGMRMRLGGLLSGLSTQRTRRGDIMARATLEDLGGTLPCVFFPKAWDRCATLVRTGQPLFLVGDLQMESERVELLVEDAISLDDAWIRLTREVRLRVAAEQASRERLRQLRELLDLTPGPVPVSLLLELPDGIDADLELLSHRVRFGPELLGGLDRLLGAGATECRASA